MGVKMVIMVMLLGEVEMVVMGDDDVEVVGGGWWYGGLEVDELMLGGGIGGEGEDCGEGGGDRGGERR